MKRQTIPYANTEHVTMTMDEFSKLDWNKWADEVTEYAVAKYSDGKEIGKQFYLLQAFRTMMQLSLNATDGNVHYIYMRKDPNISVSPGIDDFYYRQATGSLSEE